MSFFRAMTITLPAALHDLAHGSAKAKIAAAHALGEVPAERSVTTSALLTATDDVAPQVRAEAVASLAALWAPAATGRGGPGAEVTSVAQERDLTALASQVFAAIVKRLADGEPGVRQTAAIALGTLGDPRGVDVLVELLNTGSVDLRFQAVTSLTELAPARALGPALTALRDADDEVAAAAAAALAVIGDGSAAGALAAALEHHAPLVRLEAALALSSLGDGRGRQVLVAALTNAEASWDAMAALIRLQRREDAAALQQVLDQRQVPDESKLAAAGALLAPPFADGAPARAQATLLAGLASRKEHLRGIAVEQLILLLRDAAQQAWATEQLTSFRTTRKGRVFLDIIDQALYPTRKSV